MIAGTSCEKGTHAELLFCAEAGARGWQVLIPMGHSSSVDAWIFKAPGRPVSVQVKRALRDTRNDYTLNVGHGSSSKVAYAEGSFDILAAYLPDIHDFVLWTLPDLKGRKRIRYNPTRHRSPGNWSLLENFT
jgi:hypothetical protein